MCDMVKRQDSRSVKDLVPLVKICVSLLGCYRYTKQYSDPEPQGLFVSIDAKNILGVNPPITPKNKRNLLL